MSKKKATMELPVKPEKPIREKVKRTKDIRYAGTLRGLLTLISELPPDLDPSQVKLEVDVSHGYYEGDYDTSVQLEWEEDESLQYYENKLMTYEDRLANYNLWMEVNKDVIALRDEAEKELARLNDKASIEQFEIKKKLEELDYQLKTGARPKKK